MVKRPRAGKKYRSGITSKWADPPTGFGGCHFLPLHHPHLLLWDLWAGFQWVSIVRAMLNYTIWASFHWLESALESEVKPGSNPLCSAQNPHHCFGISPWTSSLLSWGRIVEWSFWAPAPLAWLCKRMLSIHIIPGQEQRHLLLGIAFSPFGVFRTCLRCVLMFNSFSDCRISENLPGEVQLERKKPTGHLWSVSGVGSM